MIHRVRDYCASGCDRLEWVLFLLQVYPELDVYYITQWVHTHTHKDTQADSFANSQVKVIGRKSAFSWRHHWVVFASVTPWSSVVLVFSSIKKAIKNENKYWHKYLWETFGLMLVAVKWHCWERVWSKIWYCTAGRKMFQTNIFWQTMFGKLKEMKMLLKFVFTTIQEFVRINLPF